MARGKKKRKMIGRKSSANKVIGSASFEKGGKGADKFLGTGGKSKFL